MKSIISIVIFFPSLAYPQLKNTGFEIKNDSISTLPKNWGFKNVDGFNAALDNSIKKSGNHSFRIHSGTNASNQYLAFSQSAPIETQNLKRIKISAFIKTEKVQGIAGLWCTAINSSNEQTGFASTQQKANIDGTTKWKQYFMELIIDTGIKKITIGGALQGKGTTWFDDFKIEETYIQPPSKVVTKFLNEFIDTVRLYSLFSDSINWTSLIKDIKELSKGMQTTDESHVLLNHILSKLKTAGDNHSFIMPKQRVTAISKKNVVEAEPSGKYIGGNIGYINVPRFQSINYEVQMAFAEKIQNIIKAIDSKNNINGWIVDLRENTGGNMYPMIAGLAPFLGNDTLGYFVSDKIKEPWFVGSGTGTYQIKIKNQYFIKDSLAKIAVLIGSKTASSGEATAISFIGKPNAKLFGQPTAGYTTGNEPYKLSDGSILNLAIAIEADRNMKKYFPNIQPDVLINNAPGTKEDATLEAAKIWLNEK